MNRVRPRERLHPQVQGRTSAPVHDRIQARVDAQLLLRSMVGLLVAVLLGAWVVGSALNQPSFAVVGSPAGIEGQAGVGSQADISSLGAAVGQATIERQVSAVGVLKDSIIDPDAIETDDTTDLKIAEPNDSNDANSTNANLRSTGKETADEDSSRTRSTHPNTRTRIIDDAVAALKADPPVYVDPRAQLKLTKEQQDELAIHIQATGDPIYVAVLPSQAGRPTVVTESIANEIGKPGVYVTIVGVVYSAYATDFEAKHLLTQSFLQERHYGQAAVLNRFVDLTSEQIRGEIEPPEPFPPFLTVIVAGMVLALPVILLLSGRRNRRSE